MTRRIDMRSRIANLKKGLHCHRLLVKLWDHMSTAPGRLGDAQPGSAVPQAQLSDACDRKRRLRSRASIASVDCANVDRAKSVWHIALTRDCTAVVVDVAMEGGKEPTPTVDCYPNTSNACIRLPSEVRDAARYTRLATECDGLRGA